MKKTITIAMCLLGVAGLYWFAQAGDLEPSAPPGPTMHTLNEIYDKLDGCTGGGWWGVPKTGQTGCWDASETPIACAGTGQDGEFQYGVAVEPRFTENGDGTVTDHLTGLIWLQEASCFGLRNWTEALFDANTLADGSCGLTDGSVPGDWRLPHIRELHSLVDYGQDPLLPLDHPFSGVNLDHYYFSSTTYSYSAPHLARGVSFDTGYIGINNKHYDFPLWPVRSRR